MFATLLGPLPRPPLPADASRAAVLEAVLAAQTDAGLEPLTDGGWPLDPADPVASWRVAAAATDRAVKAVLTGPFTIRPADGDPSGPDPVPALRATIRALAEAGCPLIEISEPRAVTIGSGETARARFRDLHQRLLDGLDGVHLSLAISGGAADGAGVETILAAPYASLAVDLIEGPDNWRLVRAVPVSVGIVCGALAAGDGPDDGPELLLWAAMYAASGDRGLDRVGLGTASSLAALPWEVAVRKMRRLGDAVRILALPPGERAAALDPRALDIRSAALGRHAPGRRGRPPG